MEARKALSPEHVLSSTSFSLQIEAENEKLLEKLKDLMVAERAPDAFQLEIKLHMDRGLIRR